ncbi:MAG: anti-sigma factor [Gemmatimonadaceae bacterium]|nr:anti-sigma factor [Gemmatimonadaceae bacterium]
MTDRLGHEAALELLAMAALDALSPSEQRMLDAHLALCPDCTRELAELRDDVATIGATLPAKKLAPERDSLMRARLMARAVADRANVTPIRRPTPIATPAQKAAIARRTSPTWMWLAAAMFVLAAGATAYGANEHALRKELTVASRSADGENAALKKRLVDQQSMIAELSGPGVMVIDANSASTRQPYARMFWNQPMNRWTFVAYNLPPMSPGHTYQLWLVMKDKKKVSAGMFEPTPAGSAMLQATYAVSGDSLAAIAVTAEPMGGSAQPTTTPLLIGAMKAE